VINETKSQHIRECTLEREDGEVEPVEKWEFEKLLDCHNEDGLHYLIKWRYHALIWQPAKDLQGQNKVILDFHCKNPFKPDPPTKVK
jgi:hypothetical protein